WPADPGGHAPSGSRAQHRAPRQSLVRATPAERSPSSEAAPCPASPSPEFQSDASARSHLGWFTVRPFSEARKFRERINTMPHLLDFVRLIARRRFSKRKG